MLNYDLNGVEQLHHFIYKQQQNFLKNKKETLSDNECIIILDFAENYTFMVQDAIQSFHWNNTQATIHPFVIYYKQDGTLKHKSLACISDMLQHDVHTLYAFQKNNHFECCEKGSTANRESDIFQ